MKQVGNIFEDAGHAIKTAGSNFIDAVKEQGQLGVKDPWASVKNYVNFTIDYAVKMPVNASASLYTGLTNQNQELFQYGTKAGRAVSTPSDFSSAISADYAGEIVVDYIPFAKDIHGVIFALQSGLLPNSIVTRGNLDQAYNNTKGNSIANTAQTKLNVNSLEKDTLRLAENEKTGLTNLQKIGLFAVGASIIILYANQSKKKNRK